MRRSSSLTEGQREAAVAWFEEVGADKGTASLLARGQIAGPSSLPAMEDDHGRGALMTKPTKRAHSFEFRSPWLNASQISVRYCFRSRVLLTGQSSFRGPAQSSGVPFASAAVLYRQL